MGRHAGLLAMIVGWQTGRGDAARRSGNWLTCGAGWPRPRMRSPMPWPRWRGVRCGPRTARRRPAGPAGIRAGQRDRGPAGPGRAWPRRAAGPPGWVSRESGRGAYL